MASSQNHEGLQLRLHFDTICDKLSYLADRWEDSIGFRNGDIMSQSDLEKMKVSYTDSESEEYWKPYAKDAKLADTLDGHEEMVAEIEDSDNESADMLPGFSTTKETAEEAFSLSLEYYEFVYFCVARAALYNPAFGPDKYPPEFEKIPGDLIWTTLHLEIRLMFGMPGYPHVTILCIQPQQAATKELLYTEFWALYYWAATICERVKYNDVKTLPIRLVSICERSARIVSAIFSSGYIRCLGTKSADPKGEDVNCKIHIGDYYDFTKPESCLLFAAKMIAHPVGDKMISKAEARARHRARLPEG